MKSKPIWVKSSAAVLIAIFLTIYVETRVDYAVARPATDELRVIADARHDIWAIHARH